ncbi:MAG: tRNA (N(6)-L-threonylcarbamoyladenosine(37)-C(2))-methylthiotransferase MtaB [Lachnospiraceae bacterium]|nr:tRNA (N(6)-L-threonylcarbamoyladenosine(37)-C(2))-methylthiotransferase MtaB [Lachnospiraceae bacterium]
MNVAFLTLGCKVNFYETCKMKKLFEEAGHIIVPFEDYADVYIINTCTVTNIADRKSRKMLHKAKRLNPYAVVVAAGCYADSAIKKGETDKSIDIFIQNKEKPDIVNIVCNEAAKRKQHKAPANINSINHQLPDSHTRAYIKIQDGCTQYCTYCIIPYVRGKLKSRDVESVVKEAEGLAADGYKEIVITGIHISSYGAVTDNAGEFVKLQGRPLLALLKELNKIDGIERIRLGSLEPRIISEGFIKELSSMPKICPHFHLSLQSGSDTVLKRMNRHYTASGYLDGLFITRKYFDNPAITTDIITGFPGETEKEFEETMDFAKKAGFAKIHVFKYSRRHGTIADKMDGQASESVKSERSARLSKLEEELGILYQDSVLKEYEKVLFEEITEINGRKYITGYNERYIRIAVPAEGIPGVSRLCNTIADVKITGRINSGILTGCYSQETIY